MSFTITILGCDGTYAGPGGACSGYLLRTETTSIWVDCGPGTLANLQTHVALADVDAIVVSHEHPDHCLELPVVRNALRYSLGLPDHRLPVITTAGTAAVLEGVLGRSAAPTLDVRVVTETDRVAVGDIDLSFSRTDHPVETLAVRAEHDGRSVAYSADTGPRWSLASLGEGIDLAVVEASLDEPIAGVQHLTATQAAVLARDAGVASLLLTHLVPGSDAAARHAEASAEFDGPVAVARLGETHEI